MGATKTARIAMRLSDDQASMIKYAAGLQGTTITEFAVSAAMAQAQDVIAGRQVFALDADAFAAFQRALDAPARTLPKLAALLERESVFTD